MEGKNKSIITIKVSIKEFESNMHSVSKFAEMSKNKGRSILLRKTEDKLIMCSGGMDSSIAMVAIDVKGDKEECKGFVDGKDVIAILAKSKEGVDELEISFDLNKSYMMIKNKMNKMPVAFDVIENVADAKDVDDVIAKYRNELVEKTYRVVRDIQSQGAITLSCNDFIDLGKSLKNTTCEVAKEEYIELRAFKELQKVTKKTKDTNGVEKIYQTEELFAIIEGVGSNERNMGICRKRAVAIGVPQGKVEMRIIVGSELLKHVSAAISSMKEEQVTVSRGIEEMCISVGKARFILPIKNEVLQIDKRYFMTPCKWNIVVDAEKLKDVMDLLDIYLGKTNEKDKELCINENKMVLDIENQKILFSGMTRENLPFESCIDYECFPNAPQITSEYADISTLHRKYIRQFLECNKNKKVSIGMHVYDIKKKVLKNREYVLDENGQYVYEVVQARLISMEDTAQGIYGVHHRVKI